MISSLDSSASSCARPIAWSIRQWQAASTAVVLLSNGKIPRSARYTTIGEVANLAKVSRATAREALGRLEESGVLVVTPAWGSSPAMFRVKWTGY